MALSALCFPDCGACPLFAQETGNRGARKSPNPRASPSMAAGNALGMGQFHPAGGWIRLPDQEERRSLLRPALSSNSQRHGGCRARPRRIRGQSRGSGSPSRQPEAEIEVLRREAQEEAKADAQRIRREAAAEMAKIQSHTHEEIASAGKPRAWNCAATPPGWRWAWPNSKIAARLSPPETQDGLVNGFVRHHGALPAPSRGTTRI